MRVKQVFKILVDIGMTVMLLLLMAYSLVGEAAHEWLGVGTFVLFVIHHVFNYRWGLSLFKGSYKPYRILQTILVVLVFVSMLGSMISGVILSRNVFKFLNIRGGSAWARTLHMLSAFWGFLFLSLHLGIHWNVIMGMTRKMWSKPSKLRLWIARAVGLIIAGYGVYAFMKRDIGNYMFLKIHFVFFDFDEPLIFFLIDYVASMGLFVFLGHYLSEILRRIGTKRSCRKKRSHEQENGILT